MTTMKQVKEKGKSAINVPLKALRADLEKAKSALEKKGWKFDTDEQGMWSAQKGTEFVGMFAQMSALLAATEGIETGNHTPAKYTTSEPEFVADETPEAVAIGFREADLKAMGWNFQENTSKNGWFAKKRGGGGISEVLGETKEYLVKRVGEIEAEIEQKRKDGFPLVQQDTIAEFIEKNKVFSIITTSNLAAEIEFSDKKKKSLRSIFIDSAGRTHQEREKTLGASDGERFDSVEAYFKRYPSFAPADLLEKVLSADKTETQESPDAEKSLPVELTTLRIETDWQRLAPGGDIVKSFCLKSLEEKGIVKNPFSYEGKNYVGVTGVSSGAEISDIVTCYQIVPESEFDGEPRTADERRNLPTTNPERFIRHRDKVLFDKQPYVLVGPEINFVPNETPVRLMLDLRAEWRCNLSDEARTQVTAELQKRIDESTDQEYKEFLQYEKNYFGKDNKIDLVKAPISVTPGKPNNDFESAFRQSHDVYKAFYMEIDRLFIQPSPTNPRKHFDDLEGLAKSIENVGIQQPIVVRSIREMNSFVMQDFYKLRQIERESRAKTEGLREFCADNEGDQKAIKDYARSVEKFSTAEGDLRKFLEENIESLVGYEIVAGERRWRASGIAGLERVPVICQRDLSEDQILEIQIIENLQRKEVEPIDEAVGYKKLLETGRYSVSDIAIKVGRPEKFIAGRLKINDLIDSAQRDLASGKLPIGHAYEIAKYSPEAQEAILKKAVYGEFYDYKTSEKKPITKPLAELNNFIKREVLHNLDTAPFSKSAENLRPDGLSCKACPQRSKAGENGQLFESEITANDNCLNPDCFALKMGNHIELKRQEIAAEENRPLDQVPYLASEYQDKYKGTETLRAWQWKELDRKDTCAFAQKGVFINGNRIGLVIRICWNKECSAHWNVPQTVSAPAENSEEFKQRAAERRQNKFEDDLRTETRRRLLEQITNQGNFVSTIFNDLDFVSRITAVIYQESYATNPVESLLGIKLEYDEDSNPTGYERPIAALDKSTRLKLLYYCAMSYGEPVGNDESILETIRLAAENGANYRLIEAQQLVELAPEEFKEVARNYLNEIVAGNDVQKPCFFFEKEFPDDGERDDDEIDENHIDETSQG